MWRYKLAANLYFVAAVRIYCIKTAKEQKNCLILSCCTCAGVFIVECGTGISRSRSSSSSGGGGGAVRYLTALRCIAKFTLVELHAE